MKHFLVVSDLNDEMRESDAFLGAGDAHARWQIGVRSADGSSSVWKSFGRIVERYGGDHRGRDFSCANQFRCMSFAQLTYRESLRDIETCLRAQSAKLYHLGIRGTVARSTLADANEVRDWRIYAEFAQHLIRIARRLYLNEPFGVDLKETVYALDATTIDLCLTLFPWAPFRSTKAAIKLHTLIDLRGKSRASFTSPRANCTTSTSWTNCCQRRAPST